MYAASEGLRAVAVEAVAPGGQAGTTSMIENYLGFPSGISGNELANRAASQAGRFGAEILLARPMVDVSPDTAGYIARLSDGTEMRARTLVYASGVDWRRLDVPGVEDLLGAGVYHGAGPSEAMSCAGSKVGIVGGGNSAGQAAEWFSKYAQNVTLLVRGLSLAASMSQGTWEAAKVPVPYGSLAGLASDPSSGRLWAVGTQLDKSGYDVPLLVTR